MIMEVSLKQGDQNHDVVKRKRLDACAFRELLKDFAKKCNNMLFGGLVGFWAILYVLMQ